MFTSRKTVRSLYCLVTLALGFVSVSVTAADTPQTWKLQYKFVPGESVHYEVHQKMEMHTEFNSATTKQTNDVWERKHYKIVSVEADGAAELETVIDEVKMKANQGGQPIDYDSTKPGSKVPHAFSQIVDSIGKPQVRVRMSPQGQLITVSRLNKNGKAGPKVSASAIPPNDPTHNFLVKFPVEPVAIGATWSEELTVPVVVTKEINREIKLLRTFELAKIENGIATLKVATSIKSRVNNPSILTQLIQRTPTGTITFDIAKGRIASRDMKTDRSVINGLGNNTVFRAVSHRTEKLSTAPSATSTN